MTKLSDFVNIDNFQASWTHTLDFKNLLWKAADKLRRRKVHHDAEFERACFGRRRLLSRN